MIPNTDMAAPIPSILRVATVLAATGLSRTTLWRAVKRGDFPAPIRLSARAVGWRRTDVERWLESRPKA